MMASASYYPKSKGDKWLTPPKLYAELDAEFHFNHDPCPIDWKEGDVDGLTSDWGTSTFCNPPYSNLAPWIKKAHDEWQLGKTVVMLINACTDTVAFHRFICNIAELRFVKGRLSFINPLEPERKTANVRPSMIVVYRAVPSAHTGTT